MRKTLIATTLATMLAPLNSTMIVVALPDILRERDGSLAWGAWLVVSYLITMAAIQPIGGSLGDRHGRRRMLIIGLVGFLAASLLAMLAWHIAVLMVARTAQALAGALAIPNATAIVRGTVPAEQRGRAYGAISSAIAIAAALGPPVGGIVTETLGWRWIFGLNLLLIVPALALARSIPSDRTERQTGRFDLTGAALLTGLLASMALALTAWRIETLPAATSPLLAGLAALSGWQLSRHLRSRGRNAVLDASIFERPGFLPASLAMAFGNLAMYTVLLSLPIFLDAKAGWSSGQTGLLLAGLSLQMVVFAPAGGWLSDRYGRRLPALSGALLIAAGIAPLLSIDPDWPWSFYLGALLIVGAGVGLSSAALQTAAIEAAPAEQASQAAGLFSTMRYLGSITGAAGMTALLTSANPDLTSFRLLYATLLLAACAAAVASAGIGMREQVVVEEVGSL